MLPFINGPLNGSREQRVNHPTQSLSPSSAGRQSCEGNNVEEQTSARDEPVIEPVAESACNRTAITKHAERINKIEGSRWKGSEKNVVADQLYFSRRNFGLAHRCLGRPQHIWRD